MANVFIELGAAGGVKLRSSISHPIQIASCPVPGGGTLGLSFCPGKHQLAAMTGAWQRDLDIDLDAIMEWGADIVISLIDADEMNELKVPLLGDGVRARSMTWIHRPIPDQQAPDNAWMKTWPEERERLLEALRQNRRIFVHCKGGLGRAGTVCAMLLMDAGMPCAEAIAAVRAARGSGAIETAAQARFLARYR